MKFDIEYIRSQFPALKKMVNGYPAIFFDGPGGTQVPQRVIDKMVDYLINCNSNIHGEFMTSVETDEVIATVGDTSSMTGPGLYFEVRHHGKPMDPLEWLSKG